MLFWIRMADDLHELSALYALDALAGEDRDRFERHLADCEECRSELDGLRRAGAAMAFAVEGPAPPAELRARVLEAARAERQNVVPLRRRTLPVRAVGAIAAVAAAAALVGIWAGTRDSSTTASKILGDPAARHVAIPGRGELVVASSGDAALSLTLPPPPNGKVYEAWVADPSVHRAGEFTGNTIRLSHDVHRGAQVMVTVERSGGVDAPTGTPLFAVRA